ncbi:MAG: type II toxin-antitoxin system prevent-host-death family antitoxin [bacterium]|nr:type II toxin-antitoxin system prevent-host-death family antitoxin [bacterium]MDE0241906.1 type II toxin-antitoxin system prevent-host-death family antitoxin [bacterium]
MTIVNVHQAKTSLSRLLAQVESGEDVIIARRGEPVARLVPFNPPGRRTFGAMKDRIVIDGSFDDPLPEDELKAWEGG